MFSPMRYNFPTPFVRAWLANDPYMGYREVEDAEDADPDSSFISSQVAGAMRVAKTPSLISDRGTDHDPSTRCSTPASWEFLEDGVSWSSDGSSIGDLENIQTRSSSPPAAMFQQSAGPGMASPTSSLIAGMGESAPARSSGDPLSSIASQLTLSSSRQGAGETSPLDNDTSYGMDYVLIGEQEGHLPESHQGEKGLTAHHSNFGSAIPDSTSASVIEDAVRHDSPRSLGTLPLHPTLEIATNFVTPNYQQIYSAPNATSEQLSLSEGQSQRHILSTLLTPANTQSGLRESPYHPQHGFHRFVQQHRLRESEGAEYHFTQSLFAGPTQFRSSGQREIRVSDESRPLAVQISVDLSAGTLGNGTPSRTLLPALRGRSRIQALTQRLRRDDLVAGFSPTARALTGNLSVNTARPNATRTGATTPAFTGLNGEVITHREFYATETELRRALRRRLMNGVEVDEQWLHEAEEAAQTWLNYTFAELSDRLDHEDGDLEYLDREP